MFQQAVQHERARVSDRIQPADVASKDGDTQLLRRHEPGVGLARLEEIIDEIRTTGSGRLPAMRRDDSVGQSRSRAA